MGHGISCNAKITNCYNVGIVNEYAIGSGTVTNCYYLSGTGNESAGAKSLTSAQMKIQALYAGFDFENVWTIDSNSNYKYPQLITNRHHCYHHYTAATTKEPTCTETGMTTYTCDSCGDSYTEEIPALGHDWSEVTYEWAEDNSTCTATRICLRDTSHKETETVNTTSQTTVLATCESGGKTTYTATFSNSAFAKQTKTVDTPASGHNYSAEWTVDVEPTCTSNGSKSHHCVNCDSKADITSIPALGHDYGEVTYTWSSDNSKCTATRVCSRDASHIETETVNAVTDTTTAVGCENDGEIKYTATFENAAFEAQTKNVPVAAFDHDWGEVTYKWSNDNSTCTATRVCSRDSSHIETETVNSTCVTTEADYYNNGNTVYTAAFENSAFTTQTKTIEIPMLVWKGFPDVREGDWYYDSVKYCSVKGFITGYKNGNFGPADALQRQDFVVILARIAGADVSSYTSCKLTDVDMKAYYGKAVAWAVDVGIIGGYQNGKFGVGDKITREQVATILYRYMDSPDVDTSVLNKFPDKGSVSSFAVNAIAWANTNGIINGKSDGKLAPTATASRAEIATIIMRMDQQGMFNE